MSQASDHAPLSIVSARNRKWQNTGGALAANQRIGGQAEGLVPCRGNSPARFMVKIPW